MKLFLIRMSEAQLRAIRAGIEKGAEESKAAVVNPKEDWDEASLHCIVGLIDATIEYGCRCSADTERCNCEHGWTL